MTKQLLQASFFWKNDQPGGLGFTFGPPSFFPEELDQMFRGDTIKEYFLNSDRALGTSVVEDYLAQLEAIAQNKANAPIQQAILAALNIMWLAERGFIPKDEFNGCQFIWST